MNVQSVTGRGLSAKTHSSGGVDRVDNGVGDRQKPRARLFHPHRAPVLPAPLRMSACLLGLLLMNFEIRARSVVFSAPSTVDPNKCEYNLPGSRRFRYSYGTCPPEELECFTRSCPKSVTNAVDRKFTEDPASCTLSRYRYHCVTRRDKMLQTWMSTVLSLCTNVLLLQRYGQYGT